MALENASKSYLKSPCADPDQKLTWLKITIAIAFICSFGLSWKLWISSRLFPLSPISNLLPVVPFPLDYIWFFLLLGLALAIIIVNHPRAFIFAFLTLAGLLALWDQTRWQPWFYQYMFMLAALAVFARKKPEAQNRLTALNGCRLIMIFTYLWSGLQKLNANFVNETWPDMAGPMLRFLPEAVRQLPSFVILIIPLLEVAIAVGLITRKHRNACVVMAIATHIVILILLIGSGENIVVWPWNIAMALFVVILFWQDKETGYRKIIMVNPFHALILLMFGILPALSLIDLWDSYLSAALYSGNTDQAVIYVSPTVIDRLPAAIHPHIWQSTKPYFLDINRWAYGELNVPVYPEPRVYKKVTEQICKYAQNSSDDVRLRIKEKPNPFTGTRKSEYYDCDHL